METLGLLFTYAEYLLLMLFIIIFHFILLELFLNPVLDKNLSIEYTLFLALAFYELIHLLLSFMMGKNF